MGNEAVLTYKESCGLSSLPILQVRHKSAVLYYEPLKRGRLQLTHVEREQKKELYKSAYSGKVTAGVRKRLTKAINIMLQVCKPVTKYNPIKQYYFMHKLSFITLKCISTDLNIRDAYDLLMSHFLDWMTRTKGVKLFIWKLEFTKSGEIHYHITTPDFIDYREIRSKWNSLLRKAGCLDRYAKAHMNFNANSTDIHGVNNVENLAAYLKKAMEDGIAAAEKIKIVKGKKKESSIAAELTKELQNEVDDNTGKIWGCSELLSCAQYAAMVCSNRHLESLEQLVSKGRVKQVSDENGFWHVFTFTDCSPPDILRKNETDYVESYLNWQLQKPGKTQDQTAFEKWLSLKPLLN